MQAAGRGKLEKLYSTIEGLAAHDHSLGLIDTAFSVGEESAMQAPRTPTTRRRNKDAQAKETGPAGMEILLPQL